MIEGLAAKFVGLGFEFGIASDDGGGFEALLKVFLRFQNGFTLGRGEERLSEPGKQGTS